MRLYPASCKEDSRFPFCTGSKNDVGDPHLHLHGETEARKQFGCFRKSLLLYPLATHLLPLGPPVMQMFFLVFLQDEIRLTEWITRRTSSYQFSHKAPVTSLPVMTLTFYAILLWIYILLYRIGEMKSQIGIHSKDPASASEEDLGLISGNLRPRRLHEMWKWSWGSRVQGVSSHTSHHSTLYISRPQ